MDFFFFVFCNRIHFSFLTFCSLSEAPIVFPSTLSRFFLWLLYTVSISFFTSSDNLWSVVVLWQLWFYNNSTEKEKLFSKGHISYNTVIQQTCYRPTCGLMDISFKSACKVYSICSVLNMYNTANQKGRASLPNDTAWSLRSDKSRVH